MENYGGETEMIIQSHRIVDHVCEFLQPVTGGVRESLEIDDEHIRQSGNQRLRLRIHAAATSVALPAVGASERLWPLKLGNGVGQISDQLSLCGDKGHRQSEEGLQLAGRAAASAVCFDE